MTIDERSRREMYDRLEELLGVEVAATLMAHMPPVGWADVATKHDLETTTAILRLELQNGLSDLRSEIYEIVDAKISALDVKIDAKISALDVKIDAKIGALDAKLDARFDALDDRIDKKASRQNWQLIIGNAAIVFTAIGSARLFR